MATSAPESAAAIATNPAAPEGERYDAQAEVTKSALHNLLIPSAEMAPVIDYINDQMEQSNLFKARSNIVAFPSKSGRQTGERGMQSVSLDDFGVVSQGQYWDRPGLLNFDSMRAMVSQTPLLNSIIRTRIRQVQRFCRPQMNQSEAGFVVCHVDKTVELNDEQQNSIKQLQLFMLNGGWEFNARRRKRMKRDTLSTFMSKSVADSLTMDAAPIETEFKRNRALGLDGFYAVDGGTIRLCTEHGYEGDDEIFALQVLQGQIRTAYSYDDLIYEVRNPRTDVMACGYGESETEMLIRVVTYLLNTMTYNGSFFDKNSIPRGLLHLSGNYSPEDLAAFRRYLMSMVKGIQNAHNLPVLVSKDQDSKAEFAEIGGQMNEMAFGKWMTLLTAIACSIYGIAPEEIAMESFTTRGSSIGGGNDTEEKLVSSNDKGLRPLLAYYENTFSDYVLQEFSPQYMFRFVGLDGESDLQRHENKKLGLTWNEFRQAGGYDSIDGDLGDAPMNPVLMQAWQVERMGTQPGGGADAGGDQENDLGLLGKAKKPKATTKDKPDVGKSLAAPAPVAGTLDIGTQYGLPDIYRVEG